MYKIICFFKGHARGETEVVTIIPRVRYQWRITCKRCGWMFVYSSPRTRLIGTELKFGFDGR